MPPNLNPDVAAIRERAEKATPDVFWGRIPETEEPDTSIICGPNGFYARVVGYPGQPSQNDAEFWTRARADIPALLARLEAVEELMREYRPIHKRGCKHWTTEGFKRSDCTCGLTVRLAELGVKSER